MGPPMPGNMRLPMSGPGPMPPIIPPVHPMDCGPPIPHHMEFGSIDPLLGSRLEPLVPPHPIPFSDSLPETFGLSLEYLEHLNIKLPLVPSVLVCNVSILKMYRIS